MRADAGDGQEALLALLAPGDLIGEMRYLTGMPRIATVAACGHTLAMVLEFATLDVVLRRHPRIMREIAGCVADRLSRADQRRVEFRLPVTTRVARVLCELARVAGVTDPGGGNGSGPIAGVVIPVTQRGLGDLVGAAEVTVQKALRQLAGAGGVTRQYGRVVIVDPAVLMRYAAAVAAPGCWAQTSDG